MLTVVGLGKRLTYPLFVGSKYGVCDYTSSKVRLGKCRLFRGLVDWYTVCATVRCVRLKQMPTNPRVSRLVYDGKKKFQAFLIMIRCR
jgi:hypothetical protein